MIEKLDIKNFKSIVDESVILSPLTLLTGMNSSGKSSVIQALRIFQKVALLERSSQETGRLSELEGHGRYKDLQSKTGSGSDRDAIMLDVHCADIGSVKLEIENEKYSYTFITNKGSGIELFEGIQYIGADRLGPQVFIPHTTANTTMIGERGENCFAFIAENEDKTIRKPVSPETDLSLRQAINYWMNEIAPGTELLASLDKKLDVSSLEVNGYRPTNVGFGVSYTLPIITALLAYANPSQPSDVTLLCIENPEAHLHPRAQTKMGELIARCASTGLQVIVETHSDHLLDGIRIAVKKGLISHRDTSINYFVLSNGITSINHLPIDERGNIDEWPEGFFDQFMINGRELLQ